MTAPSIDLGDCQCCGKEPAVGVASVPGIPVSIAWGRKCLAAGVIPYDFLVTQAYLAGATSRAWAEWFKEEIKATLIYFEKSPYDFFREVRKEAREWEESERRYTASQVILDHCRESQARTYIRNIEDVKPCEKCSARAEAVREGTLPIPPDVLSYLSE